MPSAPACDPAGLEARLSQRTSRPEHHADLDWARSGAMALTGCADGPPLLAPAPLASAAAAAAARLRELAPHPAPELAALDGPALLGERAALLGLSRRGRSSPGGSCRLLRAADGWLAASLARPDDVASLPAWLGEGDASDPWAFAEARVKGLPLADVVARARLLGMPVAPAGEPARDLEPPWRVAARGEARPRAAREAPLVLDLTSLWAGPLCAHLLGLAGARVIKVEAAERPDGARRGVREFFDLLHGGVPSVALELSRASGRDALLRLVRRADVVLESARPRALAQLGVGAEALVRERPGLVWVSLTGYGRREPGAGWVAFGDDAAAAAGLAAATGAPGPPLFCGDAIADPLAGLVAAVAAAEALREGGGVLLDVSLVGVIRWLLSRQEPVREAKVAGASEGWEVRLPGSSQPVRAPRARRARRRARPLGADTHAVLAELAAAC